MRRAISSGLAMVAVLACTVVGGAAAARGQDTGQLPPPANPPKSGPPVGVPPGGSYPPGTRPDGTITTDSKIERKKEKKKKDSKKKDELPTLSAEGLTLRNDGKYLIVHVPDGRTLTMAIEADTQWLRSGTELDPGKVTPRTTVHVDCVVHDDYSLSVTKIDMLKDAPQPSAALLKQQEAQQQSGAESDDALLASNKILHTPDAPDHPVLKRHTASEAAEVKQVATAANKKSADLDFSIDDSSSAPPKRTMGTELLGRTLDWVANFNSGLPNYVCEQTTTRYAQEHRSDDWAPQDVISANIVFEDGRETYEHIMVDNKPTKKSMMELGGQTSTGEFGGMLASLFQPTRNTDFTFERSANIGDIEVAIYNFKVPLATSDWNIIVGGQDLSPAYSGKIWVNKKTAEILRFEQNADAIPQDFPEDTVSTAVDYESIAINGRKFLLPVHAENLGCQRGTSMCGKNVIDFRNYHKYEGEGSITFH